MNVVLRRVGAVSVALLLGSTGLVAISQAASADPSPCPNSDCYAPNEVDGQAFDNGTNGSYEMQVVSAPAPTHDPDTVLIGYKALLYTGTGFTSVVSTTTTDSPNNGFFDFDGLTYGQTYIGGVQAIYEIGGDPTDLSYSDETDADSDTPLQDPPGATNVTGTAVGSGKIKISWSQPAISSVQGGVEDYEIVAFEESSSQTQQTIVEGITSSGSQRSFTLTGLTNGKVYDIGIITDVATDGDQGDTVFGNDVEVRAIGNPNKPSDLKVAFHSTGKAKLTWKGSKTSSGAPLTGYHVYVDGKLVKTLGASTHSYTATGEKKGKTYTYSVRAYNKIGSSSALSLKKKRTVK